MTSGSLRSTNFTRPAASSCRIRGMRGTREYWNSLALKALATPSADLAWGLGRADNHVTLDEVLEHLRVVLAAFTEVSPFFSMIGRVASLSPSHP